MAGLRRLLTNEVDLGEHKVDYAVYRSSATWQWMFRTVDGD